MIKRIYIGFRRGGSIIFPFILFFLRLQAIIMWFKGKCDNPFRWIPNHTFIILEYEDGYKEVIETKPNVEVISFEDTKYFSNNDYILKEYTGVIIEDMIHDFIGETQNETYEYSNFINQAIYILTDIWVGKNNINKWYCSELSSAFFNHISGNAICKNWKKDSPVTLYYSNHFKDLRNGQL
jgi:hypothetical protein